eukprot:428252_1
MSSINRNYSTRDNHKDKTNISRPYTIYGAQRSFFTQKVLIGLKWYFPNNYKYITKSFKNEKEIEKRSGTHQVPVITTPENWMIADSTPIFHLLDSRLPIPCFFSGSLITKAIIGLLEEYLDEWSGRLALHTRWHYEDSADYASKNIMNERGIIDDTDMFKMATQTIKTWGKRACRAVGINSDIQMKAGNEELIRFMTEWVKHLNNGNKFLLGDVPCAFDAVLYAGLKAHYLADPFPKRMLSKYKLYTALQNWVDECEKPIDLWNKNLRNRDLNLNSLPPFIEFVLNEIKGCYKQFILGNKIGLENKSKSFVAYVYGENVSYLTRPYVEKSRRMLCEWYGQIFNQYTKQEKEFVNFLKQYEIYQLFEPSTYQRTSKL